jgi:RimJ/RimL family protein N-acetyltransferase
MNSYKALNKQTFTQNKFSLVPIRDRDKFKIMNWRNEQIYHLRQNKPLTKESQEKYFKEVISNQFEQENPKQILFSFIAENICVGYGGLVHINWVDKNAEVSFVMNTELEKNNFEEYWGIFLNLIEEVTFTDLQLHKLYIYAFDLRPHLYKALENFKYKEDARLKEHCLFNDNFVDVVIYYKINNNAYSNIN